MRSPAFYLSGVHFRGKLHDFGHDGWQKVRLGPIRAHKSLMSICGLTPWKLEGTLMSVSKITSINMNSIFAIEIYRKKRFELFY